MKTLSLIIEARITDTQRDHLLRYSHNAASLNDFLWKSHKNEDHGHEPIRVKWQNNRIKHLDNALNKQKTTKDQTVYSGTKHDPRILKNKDDIVHHPAYLSTSKDKAIGEKFADYHAEMKDGQHHHHVLAIHVPKGSRAADLSRMKNVYDSSEKEVLLPRNSNLKYSHTESRSDGSHDHSNVFHTHHMSLIPRD